MTASNAEAMGPAWHMKQLLKNPLTWGLLLAGVLRAVLFIPHIPPDGLRYIEQAQLLLDGESFRLRTNVPPGYPAFLALLSLGTGTPLDPSSLTIVWVSHVLMSMASCWLVYAAIRPRAPRAAVVALFCMAASPVVARLLSYLLSETFSAFLSSILVFELSRVERHGANSFRALSVGFLCVALLLTSPAAIFLAFLIWCYVAWGQRRHLKNVALLAAGSLLLMIPWQLHCYRVVGRPLLTIYTSLDKSMAPYNLWCQTWMETQHDLGARWRPEQFHSLPDSLFASAEEREELMALYAAKFELGNVDVDLEPFRPAALRRIAEDPWQFYLFLPAKRCFSLWFDTDYGRREAIQLLDHFPFTKGISTGQTAVETTIRNVVGAVGFLGFNGVPLVLLVVEVLGMCSRRLMPWIIVFSVAIYTIISAAEAWGEFRRNVPFYPAILFILFYAYSNKESAGVSRIE